MPFRLSRILLAIALASILSVAAVLGAHARTAATTAARPSSPSYHQYGVSGGAAAEALNRLVARNQAHTSQAMTKVHFILNWLPNVEFAGLWVAAKYGWWKKAGIDMSFTPYSASVHPETQVPERGGNTFGFQAGAAIAVAKSKGVPIQALYADTQRSVFGLTVMGSSKIYKITDLKGKKVGYQPHELYVPATMLAHAGLKETDWTPVPVLFDTAPLTAGRVDAFLTFVTNEPIALKLRGVKTRTFSAADYGYQSNDDVLFSSTSLIHSSAALVRKVVGIVAQGFRWGHNHPVQTARLTVANYFPASGGASAQENLQQQTLELQAFSRYCRDSRGRFSGVMNTATWQGQIDTLYKFKEITSKPNPSTIFTNQFNPYK